MPTFEYTAKDPAGRELSGAMQAESEAALVRTLDQRELFPVRIRLQAQAGARRRPGGTSSVSILPASHHRFSMSVS